MGFDLIYWKAAVKAYLPKTKENFKTGIYTTLCAASCIPLLLAYQSPDTMGQTMFALGSILSGLGSNLLANKLQEWLGKEDISLDEMTALLQESLDGDEQLRKELDAILKELGTIPQGHKNLSNEDKNWFSQTLQQELEHVRSDLRMIYTKTYFEKITVTNGDFVAGNKIIYTGNGEDANPLELKKKENEQKVTQYLKALIHECQLLPMAPLGDDSTSDLEMSLDQVYIDIDTKTLLISVSEVNKPENLTTKKNEKIFSALIENNQRPISALEASKDHPRIVFLGDPGSGKSTFIKKLSGTVSHECLQNDGETILGRYYFPVMIILRDAPSKLVELQKKSLSSEKAEAAHLNIFEEIISKNLVEYKIKNFKSAFLQILHEKHCLFVFDGMDEVPQHLRKTARQWIETITKNYQPKKVILTCRIRSYFEEAVLNGYEVFTLAPFTKKKSRILHWLGIAPNRVYILNNRKIGQKISFAG